MQNKKVKKTLIYCLIAVIAYVIMPSLFEENTLPVYKNAQTPLPISPQLPIQNDIELPDKASAIPRAAIETAYKVKAAFPTQHFFDDKLCDIDQVRTHYAPEFNKAIKRLNPDYKQTTYAINELLELNIYATDMTTYFEATLNKRVKALHQHYIDMLGESAKHKVTLHLVITPHRGDYYHYTAHYAPDLTATLGVYFGGLNLAFVDYQGADDKALKTAVHESVHSLNAQILGRTPRMFNEGMAELYENMVIKEGQAEIVMQNNQVEQAPYPLMQFFDDQQWNFLDTHQLYYSSKAWVTFMHSNKRRLRSLIHFMKKEQFSPCDAFTVGESYSTLQEVYNMFEIDFIEWQESQ